MKEPIPVFILHWNRPDGCARTVQEFQNQDVPVKITVLDNGSEERNLKCLVSMIDGDVNVVCLGENLGFGGGLNEGLDTWLTNGSGEYAVTSAHDAILNSDCLSRLLKTMEDHPKVGILSPEYGDGTLACFSGLRGPYLKATSKPAVEGFEEQDFTNGIVMMFRRRCLEQVGTFDRRYFAYGDEIDLCLRARKFGWKVGFVRGVRVENPGCSVPSALASYLQVRNAVLLVKSWRGWHWAAVRSLIFGLNAYRLLIHKSKRPAVFSVRAWLSAIRDAWIGKLGALPPLK